MSSPAHGSPGWSAAKEFALLMLLTDGNRKAAQQLWLRKVRIHREAPPDAGASALPRQPQPNPSRLQPEHGPCPSWRRPPSSRGASAARSGCARSTSRARSGRACGSQAGCWRGGADRALTEHAGQSCRGSPEACSSRGPPSSSVPPLSGREWPSSLSIALSIACLSWWAS
jgi:hypothetical protein